MKVLAAPVAYNEGAKILRVIDRLDQHIDTDIVVVDDASTDGSRENLETRGIRVLRHETRQGVGAAIRTVIRYAQANGYDILVILAGNDKDRPHEIPCLLKPILEDDMDIVQGSRYLPGGTYGQMPLYRQWCTRWLHPLLFSLAVRRRITDSTNGFRAMRLEIFNNPDMDIEQPWLDAYGLEPYILFKAIQLGHRVCEVPVTKIYPPPNESYTKMRPITGWWSILRPIFILGLKLKK